MRSRFAFRPSVSDLTLEPRLVLSTASVHVAALAHRAAVDAPVLFGTINGKSLTILPTQPGGETVIGLNAHAKFPRITGTRVFGRLVQNSSLPPDVAGLSGTISLINPRGTATVAVTGPLIDASPLAATYTDLRYTVTQASGIFAGQEGSTGYLNFRIQRAITHPVGLTAIPGHILVGIQDRPTPVQS